MCLLTSGKNEREREREGEKEEREQAEGTTTTMTTTSTRYRHHRLFSSSATNISHLFSVPFILLFSRKKKQFFYILFLIEKTWK
jgi:hypothetical protein